VYAVVLLTDYLACYLSSPRQQNSESVRLEPASGYELEIARWLKVCAPGYHGARIGMPLGDRMKTYTAVVERDPDTGLFVGHIPGFPGAHSQGKTLDELNANLHEVVAMLVEDGEPKLEAEFVGTQTVSG
jgi:predicted RNase H-like HicB family nuclease